MNKIIVIIVAVIAIAGGGALVLTSKDTDKQSANTDMSDMEQMPTVKQPDTTNTSSDPVQTNAVVIKDFAYGPASITVKKGTKVTWTNQDVVQHDITPDSPTDEFKESKLLSKGGSYSVTFNAVGSFSYHCSPHPYMKGTVIVTD